LEAAAVDLVRGIAFELRVDIVLAATRRVKIWGIG
jgi:hypothetical protein